MRLSPAWLLLCPAAVALALGTAGSSSGTEEELKADASAGSEKLLGGSDSSADGAWLGDRAGGKNLLARAIHGISDRVSNLSVDLGNAVVDKISTVSERRRREAEHRQQEEEAALGHPLRHQRKNPMANLNIKELKSNATRDFQKLKGMISRKLEDTYVELERKKKEVDSKAIIHNATHNIVRLFRGLHNAAGRQGTNITSVMKHIWRKATAETLIENNGTLLNLRALRNDLFGE